MKYPNATSPTKRPARDPARRTADAAADDDADDDAEAGRGLIFHLPGPHWTKQRSAIAQPSVNL